MFISEYCAVFALFSEVRLVEILDGVCRHSDYDVSTIKLSIVIFHMTTVFTVPSDSGE